MQSLQEVAQTANTIVVYFFDNKYTGIGRIRTRYEDATYLYSSVLQSNVYHQRTKMITIVAGIGLAIFASHLFYRDIRSVLKRSKKRVTLDDDADDSRANEVDIFPMSTFKSTEETVLMLSVPANEPKDAEMVHHDTDFEIESEANERTSSESPT